jgi:hypothetical protein
MNKPFSELRVSEESRKAYLETAWPVFSFKKREQPFEDVVEAFYWLQEHPLYLRDFEIGFPLSNWEGTGLWIHYAKVDPISASISDDESKNTHTEVWLESGPWYSHEISVLTGEDPQTANIPGIQVHDIRLDCHGNTFEEAILNLAQLVNQHYGNYREGNQKDAKKAFVKMMTSDLEKLLGEAEIVKE